MRMSKNIVYMVSFHDDDIRITNTWDGDLQRFLRIHLLPPFQESLLKHAGIGQVRKTKKRQALVAAISLHRVDRIMYLSLLEDYGKDEINSIYLSLLKNVVQNIHFQDDLPLQLDAIIHTEFPQCDPQLSQRLPSVSVEDEAISTIVDSPNFPKGPRARLNEQVALEQIRQYEEQTGERNAKLLYIAQLRFQILDHASAISACREALAIEPQNENTLRMTLIILQDKLKRLPPSQRNSVIGDIENICKQLQKAPTLQTADLPVIHMALALAEAGEYERSREFFSRIQHWKPHHFAYAACLEHSQSYEYALKEYRLCLAHLPDESERNRYRDKILRLLMRLGRHQEAAKEERALYKAK